jgi:hypothetical protein
MGCESAPNRDPAEFCPIRLIIRAKLMRGWGHNRRRSGPRPGRRSAKQLNILSQVMGGVPPWCRNTDRDRAISDFAVGRVYARGPDGYRLHKHCADCEYSDNCSNESSERQAECRKGRTSPFSGVGGRVRNRRNLAVSVHRDQGAESTRLRRFGNGGSTIDSGPSPCFCQTQPRVSTSVLRCCSLQSKVGFWAGSDAII